MKTLSIDVLREKLRKELSRANDEVDVTTKIFAQPYSSYDACVAMNEARGYARGIARAHELLDDLED